MGATTVGVGLFAPDVAAAAVTRPSHQRGPVVAYVSDVSTGEVLVMAGEREIKVLDPLLAARLVRAAGSGR